MIYELRIFILLIAFLPSLVMEGQVSSAVVVDSISREPLPSASIFDNQGNIIGICNSNGRTPHISNTAFPITVRYLGFKEKFIAALSSDTIFLQENVTELPEIVVESNKHKVMHMLAYVREYSTLSTYSDTVFLFREKMVDYMLTPDKKTKFKGWTSPRLLKSKSYYRFTNNQGLDSVSDNISHHFSWSDWIGITSVSAMPSELRGISKGTYTLNGKYSPTETWIKNGDRISVDINVLADTVSRKWVSNISGFFQDEQLDFENFRVKFNYDNIIGDSITQMDLTGYSFNIESNGRGRDMFKFNRANEPIFVSTYGEVYIIDKELISTKEAKKWERLQIDSDEINIIEPADAPALQASIRELIDRVNNVDYDKIRLSITPDHRLAGRHVYKQNFGQRVLQLLKTATGISGIRAKQNRNNQWKKFKEDQLKENHGK